MTHATDTLPVQFCETQNDSIFLRHDRALPNICDDREKSITAIKEKSLISLTAMKLDGEHRDIFSISVISSFVSQLLRFTSKDPNMTKFSQDHPIGAALKEF